MGAGDTRSKHDNNKHAHKERCLVDLVLRVMIVYVNPLLVLLAMLSLRFYQAIRQVSDSAGTGVLRYKKEEKVIFNITKWSETI